MLNIKMTSKWAPKNANKGEQTEQIRYLSNFVEWNVSILFPGSRP